MIVLPAPEPHCGDDLIDDLADAGFPGAQVVFSGDTVEISGLAEDADVEAVVASHTPRLGSVPLGVIGVIATLNAVLSLWPLADAANAAGLPEQALIDEATAWSLGNE